MNTFLYAGIAALIEDATATAVIDYSSALARQGRVDTVTLLDHASPAEQAHVLVTLGAGVPSPCEAQRIPRWPRRARIFGSGWTLCARRPSRRRTPIPGSSTIGTSTSPGSTSSPLARVTPTTEPCSTEKGAAGQSVSSSSRFWVSKSLVMIVSAVYGVMRI